MPSSMVQLTARQKYLAAGALCHTADSHHGMASRLIFLADRIMASQRRATQDGAYAQQILFSEDELNLLVFAVEYVMKTLHGANVTEQPSLSVRAIMSNFGQFEVHGGVYLSLLNLVKTRLYRLGEQA